MRWTLLALRRLSDDRAATLGLAVLVFVTALLAAVSPRALDGLADQAVRTEIAAATAASRNLVIQQHRRIEAGPVDDPLAVIREAGDTLQETLPAGVRALVDARDIVVESGRFRIRKQTTDPAFVRLVIQEGIDPFLRYLEGRPPGAEVEHRDDVGPEAQDNVPVYETAVARLTAERFGLAVDDVVMLSGDPGDALFGGTPRDVYSFARVTGIYEVTDPDAEYWLGDPQLIHPVIRALSSEMQLLDAALLLDPGAYRTLLDSTHDSGHPLRYTWRSFLDTTRITGRAVPSLIEDLRRVRVAYPSVNVTTAFNTALRNDLLAILEGHQARWTAAESITAVLALGPALVAFATLALIALLAARRRRSTLALARSRGASAVQVIAPALAEGALIGVPAVIVAVLIAVTAVPAGRLSLTVGAASLVAAVAMGVVVATVVPIARAQGPSSRPDDRVIRTVGGRRLVAELLVVGLAVAGAVLLRDRGVQAAGASGSLPGFDPLLTAVPALAGVAAGLVGMRVYPLVMRVVAWLGRRRRGIVPMLGARRATEGGASAALLLVLLATATVGSFVVAVLDHLDRGAEIAAWQETGAAIRVEARTGALPSTFDPRAIPGAIAVATVFQASVPVNLVGLQVLVSLPDADDLTKVLEDTPIEPAFPPGFSSPAPGPIPAIVSQSLVDSPRGVDLGGTFTLSVEGYALEYRVVEVRPTYPGIPAGRHFVIASREAFRAAAPGARIAPGVALVRAPAGEAPEIRAAIAEAGPGLKVASQAEDALARRTSPVTAAVRAIGLAAALVTAGYAALGVAAALALAGLARTQEVAHLRTLGLSTRQSYALVFAEHGPATLAAFVAGSALGVGLFLLLRASLGLASLIGAPVDVPVVLEAGPLLLILAAMITVVVLGLLLGATLQRRVAPTAALRGRFE